MDNNNSVNFSLKGFTSILIGAYIFIAGYLINTILNGFLIDDNPLGMLSVEIVEILVFTIIFFVLLFSSLALFFKGKRNAKKNNFKLWNQETKVAFRKYILGLIIIIITIIVLKSEGLIDYITPISMIIYGILLFIFKNKERKNILILSGLSLLLAVICFLIPSYWYSSLSIIGIAHITYGVAIK